MRIQIEIEDSGAAVFDEIRQASGLVTYKDIFNHAIALFEWALRQRAGGRVSASLDEQTKQYKEMTMPALEEASRRARVAAQATTPAAVS